MILAKTNLSEWANFRSTRSTSGWSSRDGLKGKRLGVMRNHFGARNDLVSAVIEKALDVLKAQGATLADTAFASSAGT